LTIVPPSPARPSAREKGFFVQLEMPTATAVRRLKVTHANHYQYDQPVARSVHRLRLRPIHDLNQTLQIYRLQITTDVETVEFEDVFGNWVTRFEINEPYSMLSITAESVVELLDSDPFAFAAMSVRPKLPIVWMPWELKMLAPYLAPIELPDTQLAEIHGYAQSFVTKNDHDLLETLFAMNLAFFRDFSYQPASTSLETTPFDVLVNKRGVCQDFANLMICMARMLNIPARYVCGYIFTGNTGEARAQSDASHAWVQLYLPNIGWKGFDPTNGVLPATDHVRMAVGRHYRDTAPTSGTLYTPANELLTVDVEVAPAD
jgi:transglutaminase-like putative cysteine protease